MRIFCIGRNYGDHARELGNPVPSAVDAPLIFMKPAESLVPAGSDVPFPRHGTKLQYETELVVQIGASGSPRDEADAVSFIGGYSLGFDLTLRDLQEQLAGKGQPWEVSKSFEASALCGNFTVLPLQRITFCGCINEDVRQQGDTEDMIFSIPRIIFELGKVWVLKPGDLIFTGTPSGVGDLRVGDGLVAESSLLGRFAWRMVSS